MAPDLEVVILSIGIVVLPFASLGTIFVFNALETVILVAVAGAIMANLLMDSWMTAATTNACMSSSA